MENTTIRIKANFEAEQSSLVVNLNNNFDALEVLSLTLNSDEVYKLDSAQYGVLVGRVSTNGGFGIANAKVSVFIPVSDEDNENSILNSFYSYKTPYDKVNGVRYNLLPKDKQSLCHIPVGTFPDKTEILEADVWVEIYEKYYKFNAITNQSGDYMIVGLPVGNNQIHMDVDLSDIGFVSIRPYDLIAQGASPNSFNSNNKFKFSKDLDVLPHIQSANTTVQVIPFWGDNSDGQTVGITQQNFNLPIDLTPNAILFGNLYTDNSNGRITKRCKPRRKTGKNCKLAASIGDIEMVRKVSDYTDNVEYVPINGNVDEKGNFKLLVPMNLERVITDETGLIVPSPNPNIGIPTKTKSRFRVNCRNFNYKFFQGTTRAASFLVPNMYNRFQFGADTNLNDLFEMKWKKLYTVSQYIPKYNINKNDNGKNFIGIKDIDECDQNYAFPYNRIDTVFNPLYVIISIILGIIVVLAKLVDVFTDVKLKCDDTELEPDAWYDCVRQNLAENLGAIKYLFYNDWVNGSLYAPMFNYKVKYSNGIKKWEKYCDFDCNKSQPNLNYKNKCRDRYITDSKDFTDGGTNLATVEQGLVVKHDEVFYYASRHDIGINESVQTEMAPDQHEKLLFATNIVELGSSVKCDVDGVPYIIKEFVPTTYNENEEGDILLNIDNVTLNNINRNAVQLISQIETEQLSEFYGYKLMGNKSNLPEYDPNTNGNTDAVAFTRNNLLIREYLCKNWKYYNTVFTYNSYLNAGDMPNPPSTFMYEFDEDSQSQAFEDHVDFNYDECIPCTQNNKPSERIHPYYFYFGTNKGENSLDVLLKDYFSDCD